MPTINEYLKYANLQMAAEAFLLGEFGLPFTDPVELKAALTLGNKHASRFTSQLADEFLMN